MPIEKERSEKVRREIWELSKVKRPIEKEKPSKAEARLYKQLQLAELAREGQGMAWKIGLADDLNTILARAQYHLEQAADESDIDFARAVLRVVGRVAEFEGIRRASK